jgi:hypothetical protein
VEADLERAKAARSEREREHWSAVSSKLPPGVARWAALVAAKARPGSVVDWPLGWGRGRKPMPSERVAAMGRLREQYPFEDEGG